MRCDVCADLSGYGDRVADFDLNVLPEVQEAVIDWLTTEADDEDELADADRLRSQIRT